MSATTTIPPSPPPLFAGRDVLHSAGWYFYLLESRVYILWEETVGKSSALGYLPTMFGCTQGILYTTITVLLTIPKAWSIPPKHGGFLQQLLFSKLSFPIFVIPQSKMCREGKARRRVSLNQGRI